MQLNRLISDRRLWSFILAATLYALLQHLVGAVLPGVWELRIVGHFDRADKVQIYWDSTQGPVAFNDNERKRSDELAASKRFTVKFNLSNMPVNALRIDMGLLSGVSRLYAIGIYSKYHPKRILQPDEIYRLFRPVSEGTRLELKPDYVEIQAETQSARLRSLEPLPGPASPFHRYGLTALIAACLYLVLLRSRSIWRFFQDEVSTKKQVGPGNIDALDGLRGLAAIMVIADHTMGVCKGLGTFGVWIFFGLSGFLIARPFVAKPELAVNSHYLLTYVEKRIRRVVPVYYIYITGVFLVTNRLGEAIRHFLFLQGNGHLWAIPQEMLFYAVAPLILSLIFIVLRGNRWASILLLLAIMLAANRWLDRSVISLFGSTFVDLRFFLGIFVCGMMFAYLYFGFLERFCVSASENMVIQHLAAMAAPMLLFGLSLFSIWHWVENKTVLSQSHFGFFGFASGLLIMTSALAQRQWWGRILSWVPLRSVGVVSLSLYLFHPVVINVLKRTAAHYFGFKLHGLGIFIATLIVSYLIAVLSYLYFEKRFIKLPQKSPHSA